MSSSQGSVTIKWTGLCNILGLIFVVLKLGKVITWSWLWVLSPFWLGWGLCIIAIVLYTIIMLSKELEKR